MRGVKIILWSLLVIAVIGFGLGVMINQNTPEDATMNTLIGTWETRIPNTHPSIDTDSVTITFSSDTFPLNGTLLGLGIFQENARYITEGSVTVVTSEQAERYHAQWTGSRDDAGSASITHTAQDTLEWSGTITSSDGLYTIPTQMTFTRKSDPVSQLSPSDNTAILTQVLQYVPTNSAVQEIDAQIIAHQDTFAVVQVVPLNTITDPAYVYVEKQGTNWTVIAGPGTAFSQELLENLGIPESIWQ